MFLPIIHPLQSVFSRIPGRHPVRQSPVSGSHCSSESLQRHGNAQPGPRRQSSPEIHIRE